MSDPVAAPAGPRSRFRDAGSPADFDLLRAAHAGLLDEVKQALDEGANVGAADPVTGLTALHIAVGTNNLALVRYLIEEWQAPFGPDRFGRWPTVVAAECYASEELCDYIVEQEARFTPPSK